MPLQCTFAVNMTFPPSAAIGEELHIAVTGNGFLHSMVRIIVGTLLEVGRGERKADSIPELFGAKRANAGFLAPAQGLCLQEVYY